MLRLLCFLLSITAAQYAPVNITCPDLPLVRQAFNISAQERSYLAGRAPIVQAAMRTYLQNANVTGLDIQKLFSNQETIPRIAFAASGGGLRAMIVGGSMMQALDSRVNTISGSTGGILQACQYMVGLSGGSWLIGSVAINDFPTVSDLATSVWDVDNAFTAPTGGLIKTAEYYTNIVRSVQQKNNEGFFTSITDYWGRIVSFHVLNSTTGLTATTWSDIQNVTSFQNYQMPFPIVIADARAPGQKLIPANATVYEFNPYEFGSWDSNIYAFTPIRTLGSNLFNGLPVANNTCVRNFDNIGFTIGTSSSLFNAVVAQAGGQSASILTVPVKALLNRIGDEQNDIAYYPNPFRGLPNISQNISNSGNLTLVDGGLDNQNIPLWPLIQPERQVDTIFAVDSSADSTYLWPNGSSLVHTYRRVTSPDNTHTNKSISFPYIPDFNTFINLGLNQRLTFFGCNATNGTLKGVPPAIIVYMPNSPYSFNTNFSTFDGEFCRFRH